MAMVQTRSDLGLVIKNDLDILGRLSCGHAQDHDTNVLNKTTLSVMEQYDPAIASRFYVGRHLAPECHVHYHTAINSTR